MKPAPGSLRLLAGLAALLGLANLCQGQEQNPVITGVYPTSIMAGSPGFPLTIAGQNFLTTSYARWMNNQTEATVSLACLYNANLKNLTCTVPDYLVASPGTASIQVVNPDPIGEYYQYSNWWSPFTITPELRISAISPSATTAGCRGVVVNILGVGFMSGVETGSVVQWASPGMGLRTLQPTFISSSEMRVTIPDELLANPGYATMRVLNLGGVYSNAVDFTINAAPAISALDPDSVGAGGPEFTLRILGAGFLPSTPQAPGSVVQWTGPTLTTTDLATDVRSASELRAQVPAGLITSAGTVRITVVNPPCAARSNVLLFEIVAKLAITTTSLPNGTVGAAYSASLATSGGATPYSWSAKGDLPPGLKFDASTAAISGTPVTAGSYTLTVEVRDRVQASASRTFTITVARALAITTESLPNGTVGAAYSATLAASGGWPSYSWSMAGSLPPGLSLNASTGAMSGTPTSAGTFNFTVRVTDSAKNTAERAFALTIGHGLTVVTTALPGGGLNASYSQKLLAYGGAEPYTWAVSAGSLPPGLTLNGNTGDITGTPTAAGAYNFTAQVTDRAQNTASRAFTIVIIGITTASPLPAGVMGVAYSQTLTAMGGVAPYAWSISAGSLPAGLSLGASNGAISGAPATAGTFSFTVRVTDSAQNTTTHAFSLTISALPALNFAGVGDTVQPAQQPRLQVNLASNFPAAISGQLTLSFEPDAVVPSGDPAVQFSTGDRRVDFTIPPGSTRAQFGSAQDVGVQVGTVAGTITVTTSLRAGGVDVTPSPAPSFSTRIPRQAPAIRSVRVTRTASGFEVEIIGYATPRQVTGAAFRFSAPGVDLTTPEIPVNVDSAFGTWYRDATSGNFGSQFRYVQPFTVSGEAGAVNSVTVTLTNASGTSSSASANF